MSMAVIEASKMLEDVRVIARDVAAARAAEVDAEARFPHETFDALRAAGVLSAPLPGDWGGADLGMLPLGAMVSILAQGCASSAMVLAMHYSQLACLMRHGHHPDLRAFLMRAAAEQLLVASITSEVGTAGDTRRSLCAVHRDGAHFSLEKKGTTSSYAEQADAILVTARSEPDAAEGDQVLVLVQRGQYELVPTSAWNTLGMRGTCSPGVHLKARAPESQILAAPFADIASVTMVPYAHILWSAVWTGIATGAYRKAASFVRRQAVRGPEAVSASAARLAAMNVGLQSMRDGWMTAAAEFDTLVGQGRDATECASVRWALRMNNLKIASSEAAPCLVLEALQAIGVAAYRNDGEFSLGREYRDALSAALMISNDRIRATNASLLLVSKDA